MDFDPHKVLANVRAATTDDLLERCTVFRSGMEPEALEIIEDELARRGIDQAALDARGRDQADVLQSGGLPIKCSFCHRGAILETWGWHRLWGLLPLFPRRFYRCPDHQERQD